MRLDACASVIKQAGQALLPVLLFVHNAAALFVLTASGCLFTTLSAGYGVGVPGPCLPFRVKPERRSLFRV